MVISRKRNVSYMIPLHGLGVDSRARQDDGMGSAEVDALALAQRLAGIRDTDMRASYVRHRLTGMPAAEVAQLLLLTMSAAEARDVRHLDLLQSMSLALADQDCEDLRARVAEALRARDQFILALALCEAPENEDPRTTQVPDFGVGRPLSLGERKSLARRNDPELIQRVLRDPNADVIRILLGNPGLTEHHIVHLCARRPIAGSVLREVFRCARWIVRYRVKLTIMLNPHTPLDICLQLAPMLNRRDLARVLDSPDLPTTLREACRRMSEQVKTVH